MSSYDDMSVNEWKLTRIKMQWKRRHEKEKLRLSDETILKIYDEAFEKIVNFKTPQEFIGELLLRLEEENEKIAEE